jgi:hypothetical protein
MNKQYFSCPETAKLVRAALKESFPGIKFSVKSSVYSGGASIRVSYFDGPSEQQVKNVVGVFEGAYFDGMTDFKGYNYNSLDGQEVHFGADYIFVERKFSVAYLEILVDQAAAYLGFAKPAVIDTNWGAQLDKMDYNVKRMLWNRIASASMVEPANSPTYNRVGFLGDDGYGLNSVGRL